MNISAKLQLYLPYSFEVDFLIFLVKFSLLVAINTLEHPSLFSSLTHSLTHPATHPFILSFIHSPSHYHKKGAEQWTALFNNTIHWQIKHFTVTKVLEITIFPLNLIFFFFAAKKPPYLGPQSPYQKLRISLFHSKLISHVWS